MSKFNNDLKKKIFSKQFVSRMDISSKTVGRIIVKGDRGKVNKCNLCDYNSPKAENLKIHLKAHSGEKSFKCNQCDNASVEAGDLMEHLKIHSGEKSYKCNQCDYASARAGHLRIHLKTHSGEKSYKCN